MAHYRQSFVPIKGAHPTSLAYYEWLPPAPSNGSALTPARGIVQLVHGMVEHLGRYDAFAHYLTEHRWIVVGADHRGHGLSANENTPLGYFGDGVAWETVAEDIHHVRAFAQRRYPGLPHVVLGHSMGSMLVREYLKMHSEGLAGAVIIGTATWPKIGDVGLALARTLSKAAPARPGKLLNALAFGPYEKPFEHRTYFDWLNRDQAAVDKYVADPLSGYVASNAFFRELLRGIKRINSRAAFEILPELALYIASGEVDPVGGAAAVTQVARRYLTAGSTNVTEHIYPQARHEILNEINKAEVWADLLSWLESIAK